MPIDDSNWQKDQQGNIELHTLMAVQVVPATPLRVAVRLEWATSQAHLDSVRQNRAAPQVVQLGLTLREAKAIAHRLHRIAEAIEKVLPHGHH